MKKKILSLLLVVCLSFEVVPVSVFADSSSSLPQTDTSISNSVPSASDVDETNRALAQSSSDDASSSVPAQTPFVIENFGSYDMLGAAPYLELTAQQGTPWDALELPATIECTLSGAQAPTKVPVRW